MTIARTSRFKKDFAKLPQKLQKQAIKNLELFLENPRHPSLHIKRMQGYPNIWEGRISKGYRFTFTIKEDQVFLRRIGTHDILQHP